MEIQPTSLGRNLDDALTLCGEYDAATAWDLQIGGQLNLEVLRGLKDRFSVLEGRLSVGEDTATVEALGTERCLPNSDSRILRLQGDLLNPRLDGILITEDVLLAPRNFGREVRIDDGVAIRLRPGKSPGLQHLIVDETREARIRGEIEDGKFEVWGQVALKELQPDKAMIRLVGTEIFHAEPGEYNVTFNPDVTLTTSDFMDDNTRKLALEGSAQITEGTYYKNFDTLGQAFGNLGGSGGTTHQLPLVERRTLAQEHDPRSQTSSAAPSR